MNDLYEQRKDETPFDWIERVLKTVAYRMLFISAGLFLLGYAWGLV